MIEYEVGISRLSPQHFNDARYAYEISVLRNGKKTNCSGIYGCTFTLWGAKYKLRRKLRHLENVLSPHKMVKVVDAKGSIVDITERVL